MPNVIHFPMLSIEIAREEIPVNTMSPQMVPDERWRFMDKKGHGHFWDGDKLPTLKWMVTGTAWAGDEYDGDEYETGEYRCKLCKEVIKPGKKRKYGPTHIPGPTWVTVTINGESFVLSQERYAKSLQKWARILKSEEAP